MSSANTGLLARMTQFFENNPSEELTKADMQVKFDAELHSIEQVLWKLKASGLVERTMVFRRTTVPAQRGMRVEA